MTIHAFLIPALLLGGTALASSQGAGGDSPSEALKLHFPSDGAAPGSPQRRLRYEALMTSLGRRSAPAASDSSAEAEVVRVARDRLLHPARYKELEEFYVKQWAKQVRIPSAAPPQPQHLSEAYRYAWEYLYLRPGDGASAPGYGYQASKAMSKIHNDDSLALVAESFAQYTKRLQDGSLRDQVQTGIIEDLSRYVSERGLDALLQCASLMSNSQSGGSVPEVLRTDVGKLVRSQLVPKFSPERAEAWSVVIESYGRNPKNRSKMTTLRRLLTDPSTRP